MIAYLLIAAFLLVFSVAAKRLSATILTGLPLARWFARRTG